MKKFLAFAVVGFVVFILVQKNDERQRQKVVGVWSLEQSIPGGQGKMVLNLKEDGNTTVEISAHVQGRIASRDGFGTWKYSHSNLLMHIDRGDILPLLKHHDYGGTITNLDDRSLTYRGKDGVETWTRLR